MVGESTHTKEKRSIERETKIGKTEIRSFGDSGVRYQILA